MGNVFEAWTARIEEKNAEIERQHGEITELKKDIASLEGVVEAQGLDVTEASELADRLSEAITSAIADLRVLGEVPLGELEESIKAIADGLADKNGELC